MGRTITRESKLTTVDRRRREEEESVFAMMLLFLCRNGCFVGPDGFCVVCEKSWEVDDDFGRIGYFLVCPCSLHKHSTTTVRGEKLLEVCEQNKFEIMLIRGLLR